jgi:hypothetical protein
MRGPSISKSREQHGHMRVAHLLVGHPHVAGMGAAHASDRWLARRYSLVGETWQRNLAFTCLRFC